MNSEFNRKFVLILGLIGFCILLYGWIKGNIDDKKMQFNGKVDSVAYDIKGQARVTIKGRNYDLDNNNWDFDHNRIQKGDSMIKDKNTLLIKLIKKDGQLIVVDGN